MSRSALADVDLNLLLALDVLLREASVTRAAARLGVTQSAMSHTLQRLRAQWGDPLLVRRGAEMTTTPLADRLVPEIGAALDGIEKVLASRRDFDPKHAVRRFAVLASDYAQAVVFPELLRRLRRSAPNVDLLARAVRDPERALADRDFALMIGPARDELPTLMRQRLFLDRLVCVARAGHPALEGDLTLQRFVQAQHVLVSPRGSKGGMVDDALRRLGGERRVVLEVPHFFAAALLVAQSDCLLTIPERLAAIAAPRFGLALAPLPVETPPIEFVQLWHARDQDDAGHAWLRAQVAAACRV